MNVNSKYILNEEKLFTLNQLFKVSQLKTFNLFPTEAAKKKN